VSDEDPPKLLSLSPDGGGATAEEIVERWGLFQRPTSGRRGPRVLLNMVSTADGRATLAGRSAPISSPADRALFHALRSTADAVLVGAGTVRTERYGRIVRDERMRRRRRDRGLVEEPLACIVSGRLDLDSGTPLLSDAHARVLVLTASAASVPGADAQVSYIRRGANGELDLGAAIEALHDEHDVQLILCEGGPHLARTLFAEELIDELFLSISPILGGGTASGSEAVRILAGTELEPPVELELLDVLRESSHLFLRYGVR
jgi:riboflavin biosynthesis pyrimidine reductase